MDKEFGRQNECCYWKLNMDEIDSQIIDPLDKEALDTFVDKNRGKIARRFFESELLARDAVKVFSYTIQSMKNAQMSDDEIAQALENAGVDINDKTLLKINPQSLWALYEEDAKPENMQATLLQQELFKKINKTEVDFFFDKILEAMIKRHPTKSIAQISGILETDHPELIKVYIAINMTTALIINPKN